MATVPKFIRDFFTEDDAGQIWSLAHAQGFAGFVTYNAMLGWHTITTHAFDPTAAGTGEAAVLAGAGAMIFANSRSGTTKSDGTPK